MYDVNGDYGQVEMYNYVSGCESDSLFSLMVTGWHRCNDRYCIYRPDGCGEALFMVTVAGEGAMEINGVKYRLTPGSVAFIPRNVKNKYYTPKDGMWEFYWLHPDGRASRNFTDELAKKGVFFKNTMQPQRYADIIRQLMETVKNHGVNSQLYISAGLSEFLHLCAIDFGDNEKNMTLGQRAAWLLEKGYTKSIEISDIADKLYVSEAHLIRSFKKEFGVTPHRYLIDYRLACAKQLIDLEGLSIKEIAGRTGFSSASHFISCFKKKYKTTPAKM